MGSTERLHIRWNDFESNIKCGLSELRQEKELFDVTLACGSKQIKAHKVILSACSPFFRSIIKSVPHEHPLLYLRGVQFHHLESLLAFIYNGEVNVTQEELDSFLAVAEELKIKGLAHNEAFISSLSVPESHPPPNKRPRNEDQGISPEPSITGLCISAYSLKTHSSLVISKETSPNPSKFPPQKEQDIPIGEDDDEIEDVTIVKEEDKYVFESNNDEVGLDNQSQELENELHDVKYIEDHIDFESESEELCCDTLRDSENTSHPDLNKGGFEKQVFFKLPKLEERVQAIPGSIQGFGSKVRKKKIGQEEFNKPFSKLANTKEEYDSFGRQLVASDYKMRKEIEFQQPPPQSKKRRHISATCAVASCP